MSIEHLTYREYQITAESVEEAIKYAQEIEKIEVELILNTPKEKTEKLIKSN